MREAETCAECRGVFLTLYPISVCDDHEGLDNLMRPKGKKERGEKE